MKDLKQALANGDISAESLVDRIEEQAREIERLDMESQNLSNQLGACGCDLAALKAQPSGVVSMLRDALELWLSDYDEVASNPDFEPFPHVANRVARTRAALDSFARLNQPASAQETDDLGFMTTKQWDFVYARAGVKPASAGDETNYPPCDYCAARINYHPWHGSGMFNGVESRHIHACNDCRHKLPKSNASSAGDERAAFEAAFPHLHHRRYIDGVDQYESDFENGAWLGWQKARAALSANHSEQVRVPEGWQLVPVEANEEMIATSIDLGRIDPDEVSGIWESMLAAAPSAGSQGGDV